MGWWEDLSGAVSDAVDTAAGVVQAVVDAAGDAVTDFVETGGNAAADGLNAVGVPWLGGVLAGITNLAGATIKAGFAIVSGIVGGLIRIVGGLLTLNGNLILKGLIDIGSGIAGALIVIAGTLLSLIQRLFFLQSNDRALTKQEKDMLRRVLYNSLALYNIRLIEGWSGAFGINDRAFTLANTIYLKGNDPAVRPDVLVHECVHVWQYQNIGSRYTMDALGAQAIYGDAAYDWEAELTRGNSDWNDFNKEAQAQLIQDIWRWGSLTFNGHTTDGDGCFYDLEDVQSRFDNGTAEFIFRGTGYTDLATQAIKSLRGSINLRWSRSF